MCLNNNLYFVQITQDLQGNRWQQSPKQTNIIFGNSCTLKDMFKSSPDIGKQEHNLFMTTLDIDSLYTNISNH